jgi:hypothetical protein
VVLCLTVSVSVDEEDPVVVFPALSGLISLVELILAKGSMLIPALAVGANNKKDVMIAAWPRNKFRMIQSPWFSPQ